MKAYKKPEILFEDFSLSTNIAVACEYSANSTESNCSYPLGDAMWGDATIFAANVCTIEFTSDNGGFVDKNGNTVCYHNPSESSNIFASF